MLACVTFCPAIGSEPNLCCVTIYNVSLVSDCDKFKLLYDKLAVLVPEDVNV